MASVPDLVVGPDGRARCGWVGPADRNADYHRYHDTEWGRPVVGDAALFDRLSLEAMQAGLSWLTILRRREALRDRFSDFDPAVVARLDDGDIERLVQDPAIIRSRAKIVAVRSNARLLLDWQERAGGEVLDAELQRAARGPSGAPATDLPRPRPRTLSDLPTTTAGATAVAADFRRRGWKYLGPVSLYAALQAVGLIDDHLEGCWVVDGTQGAPGAV